MSRSSLATASHFVKIAVQQFSILATCTICSALKIPSIAFADAESVSAIADGSLQLKFPRDHGSHPEFGTEWWYYTGHLTTIDSRTFGFELTFFRILVDPVATKSKSQWASQSLFLAHFTITDDKQNIFYSHDAIARESFNQAHADEATLNVHLGTWHAALRADNSIELAADSETQKLKLTLRSEKPVILEGQNGFSKKGPAVGEASYYTSFSRLTGTGTLKLGSTTFEIPHALAWMDHEFMSSHKNSTALGWDWFAIQLHDGREIMLYELHTAEKTKGDYSSGSVIERDGSKTTLNPTDFEVTALGAWQSPKTETIYPSSWRVKIPSQNIDLIVTPTVKDQELITTSTTGVTYWEGRNTVADISNAKLQVGDAYVELVGYEKHAP